MFSSHLMNEPYQRILPDYETYRQRVVAEVEQVEPGDVQIEVPPDDNLAQNDDVIG
jgi:hypothetical protein